MPFDPLYHSVVVTDVEKSGSRDDPLLLRMRADLRQILADALDRQRIAVDRVRVDDLGDGFRLLLPADISPRAALDPFVPDLATALRLHRSASSEANRLRLRVAIHAGLLHPEPGGTWTGAVLTESARLLDAPAARRILRVVTAADLVVVVSQTLYDTVVRHGYTLDPATFHPIRVRVKETDEVAWVHVPGAIPPVDAAPAGEPEGGGEAVERGSDHRRAPAGSIGMFGDRNRGVFIIGDHHTFGPVTGGTDDDS